MVPKGNWVLYVSFLVYPIFECIYTQNCRRHDAKAFYARISIILGFRSIDWLIWLMDRLTACLLDWLNFFLQMPLQRIPLNFQIVVLQTNAWMEQHASKAKTHSIASAQNTPLAGSVKRKLLLQLVWTYERIFFILVASDNLKPGDG